MDVDYSKLSTDELLKLRDQEQAKAGLKGVSTDQLLKMRAKAMQRPEVNEVPEQLREHGKQSSQETGILGSALEKLGGAAHTVGEFSGVNALAGFAKDAYVGKQDPRYSQLGGFSGEGLGYNAYSKTDEGKAQRALMSPVSPIEGHIAVGKGSTLSDKGYGNVIKKSLGDLYLGSEYDQHGQEIITYKGYDGETYKTYVNKPGLDLEDVSRFVHQAAPFVGTGGAAGAVGKILGSGLKGRSALQGAAALGTDITTQVAGQEAGNKEDYSISRSGMALAGGVGGELLGTALNALFRNPGLIDKATGKLTEKGKEWARANKLDPDAISDDVAKYINQNADKVVDPEELARVARTSEFDIPMTRAQRTKSQSDAYTELEITKGNLRDDAQRVMDNFQKEQTNRINLAAMEQMGDGLAPKAAGREKVTLGDDLRTGLNDIHSRSKQTERKLWSEIGPMYPKDGAFENFSKIINKKADEAGVSPLADLSPSSAKMAEYMEGFMNGELKTDSPGILSSLYKNGEDTAISIDTARRKLLDLKGTAQHGSPDARLANKLYEGFNEWIDDAAEKALIQGDDVAAYAKLKTARAFTREQHKKFTPRDKHGKLTPSAKKIEKIMEGEDSPEGVISALFGRGNEVSQLANGTVETLAHLRRLLKPSDRAGTFDSIKMAYWVKLVQGKEGKVLSPTRISSNLDKAFANHKTAINVMFNKQEQALMRRFNVAMKDLHVEHPNPSLSAIGVGKIITKLSKGMLNTHATRERFTKQNFLQAHIYNSIAKLLDHMPFVDASQFAGKRFVKQGLRTQSKNRIKTIGGVGAFGSVQGYRGDYNSE